jgi:deazaflavin-dependent oxidoreductase (nitroreductase family)
MNDFNATIIDEFRANEGRVGGRFEGAPMVLVHHQGRKSGKDYINPMVFLPDDNDPKVMYVFASKGGHHAHPDWYHNLVAAGRATVEVGTETFEVDVEELTGSKRDGVYAEQVSRNPHFGEYEKKTEGVRTIPVLSMIRR